MAWNARFATSEPQGRPRAQFCNEWEAEQAEKHSLTSAQGIRASIDAKVNAIREQVDQKRAEENGAWT